MCYCIQMRTTLALRLCKCLPIALLWQGIILDHCHGAILAQLPVCYANDRSAADCNPQRLLIVWIVCDVASLLIGSWYTISLAEVAATYCRKEFRLILLTLFCQQWHFCILHTFVHAISKNLCGFPDVLFGQCMWAFSWRTVVIPTWSNKRSHSIRWKCSIWGC